MPRSVNGKRFLVVSACVGYYVVFPAYFICSGNAGIFSPLQK